ncbi:MAG: hypothetical protein ACT4P3_04035 [Betaproteobacteria bacterium]
MYGLWDGARRHGRASALWIGGAGAFVLSVSVLIGSGLIAAAGIAALIAASALNVWLAARGRSARPA